MASLAVDLGATVIRFPPNYFRGVGLIRGSISFTQFALIAFDLRKILNKNSVLVNSILILVPYFLILVLFLTMSPALGLDALMGWTLQCFSRGDP